MPFLCIHDNDGLLPSIHALISAQGELSENDDLVSVPLLQRAPKKQARQAKPHLDRSAVAVISPLNNREGRHIFHGI